jgi:hypothetical protein
MAFLPTELPGVMRAGSQKANKPYHETSKFKYVK